MTVAIGQPIPACAIPATSDLTFSPASAKGKKLVLYFYPKDMTPGCTAESGEFRDNIDAFTKANTLVVGVSRDSLRSHDNFRSKLGLPFKLVADTEETLCQLLRGLKVPGHVTEVLQAAQATK